MEEGKREKREEGKEKKFRSSFFLLRSSFFSLRFSISTPTPKIPKLNTGELNYVHGYSARFARND
jgi:hypothetical protein